MSISLSQTKTLFLKYKRYILPAAFVFGFVFDYLTLTRIDRFYDNFVLLGYLVLAALSIAIVHSSISYRLWQYLQAFAPTVTQFAFGGLFSGFLVFYSRSASLAASWPFLLLLITLIAGNELLKTVYSKFTLQLTVFFFVLFSYFIFLVPIIIKRMNSWVFLLSGLISLLVMYLFIYGLTKINKQKICQSRKYFITAILTTFLIINVFYFTNIIPPIPLSLKDIDVYYSVERVGGDYRTQSIPQPWYRFLLIYDRVPVSTGQPLFVLSSVFAPTALKTNIVHNWQHYNPAQDKWINSLKIEFPTIGGRDGGYRGFSKKETITPGYWRVDVETPNGLLIGREKFLVQER